MVQPSGEGAVRCMKMAMKGIEEQIDYINPHATSTPVGDTKEIDAIKEVFGSKIPPLSATKSLTGHSLGAVSYTHLRAHETARHLVCRLLLVLHLHTASGMHMKQFNMASKI